MQPLKDAEFNRVGELAKAIARKVLDETNEYIARTLGENITVPSFDISYKDNKEIKTVTVEPVEPRTYALNMNGNIRIPMDIVVSRNIILLTGIIAEQLAYIITGYRDGKFNQTVAGATIETVAKAYVACALDNRSYAKYRAMMALRNNISDPNIQSIRNILGNNTEKILSFLLDAVSVFGDEQAELIDEFEPSVFRATKYIGVV